MQILEPRGLKRISQGSLREPALSGQGNIANVNDHPDVRASQLPEKVLQRQAFISDGIDIHCS